MPGNAKVPKPQVALVAIPDASTCLVPSLVDRMPASLLFAASFVVLIGAACLVAALPLLSYWGICAVFTGIMALGAIPAPRARARAVDPDDIRDHEVACAYRALLAEHAALGRTLAELRDSSALAVSLLDSSRDIVIACGQIALVTNRAQPYLAEHDRAARAADVGRLSEQATATKDEDAARMFRAAADASTRELAACDALVARRDRARARVELAAASLREVTARIVQLTAANESRDAVCIDERSREMAGQLDALAAVNAFCSS